MQQLTTVLTSSSEPIKLIAKLEDMIFDVYHEIQPQDQAPFNNNAIDPDLTGAYQLLLSAKFNLENARWALNRYRQNKAELELKGQTK